MAITHFVRLANLKILCDLLETVHSESEESDDFLILDSGLITKIQHVNVAISLVSEKQGDN